MGIYHKWVCRTRHEHFDDPFNENIKHLEYARKTMIAVTWLAQNGSWAHEAIEIINDTNDEYYEVKWKDPPDVKEAIMEAEKVPIRRTFPVCER